MKNLYDDKDFWVTRVTEAKAVGDPYFSVYRSGPKEWSRIINGRTSVISQEIKEKDKILDAGCGFGWLSQFISNEYVGVDQTPALLDYGRELYPGINLIESELQKLPFENNSFDWVVCSCVKQGIVQGEELGMMEIGRWDTIEKEFLRVAKGAIIWPSYSNDYEITRR
jgi:SAM-dependent methyltransferase